MARILQMHPSDQELELYALECLADCEADRIEQHYINCPECLAHLEHIIDNISALYASTLCSYSLN